MATQGTVSLEGLSLNRYPDPKQMEVKALLAEMRGVRPEQIFVGVGSDEAIDLLIRIFCSPGNDTIIVTPPTYGMYKVTFCSWRYRSMHAWWRMASCFRAGACGIARPSVSSVLCLMLSPPKIRDDSSSKSHVGSSSSPASLAALVHFLCFCDVQLLLHT